MDAPRQSLAEGMSTTAALKMWRRPKRSGVEHYGGLIAEHKHFR